MKLVLVLVLACFSLLAVADYRDLNWTPMADKVFLEKQKFLFEIVYRVEDPLMFEQYIKDGDKLNVDKSSYEHYDLYMEKFYESYKMGALLPKGEFFGVLAKTHYKQARGLFYYFYYAKDWQTFYHNVCWARMHVNEGMFVYALNLAVIHRDDFLGLIMPTIYEIFPQHFFHSKFVYEAEKFDYSVWSKNIMYEKEFYDVFYKDNKYHSSDYFYMKDWKMWQWWKLMGLGEHWHSNEKYILRENTFILKEDAQYMAMMKNVKKFYMPVDYTRDVHFYNDHSKLSYFTEDLGWNAYWYYLNMDAALFLDGKTFGLSQDRRGEYWLFNVQQILARYYLERLSHGFGDIPEFTWYHQIEHGYNPELISYNGVGFSSRPNYYEMKTYGNFDMLNNILGTVHRIYDIIDSGQYKMHDGTVIDLRQPEAIEYIGNIMQGNIDAFDKYFFTYWTMLSHMYVAEVDYNDLDVHPHVFLNFETMMRDPMFYIFYKKIADVFYRFKYHFAPYTREELFLPGVEIKNVEISHLKTYYDMVDFDVTNLMNDKMQFADGEFVWDKALFARQMRLNHIPYHVKLHMVSDKSKRVVIRIFIGPKFDAWGRAISLADNRENFVQLYAIDIHLRSGNTTFTLDSDDYTSIHKDRLTYTELYHYMMIAYEGKYNFHLGLSKPHCAFPDRLTLPHGWVDGMPMQFFFMVTPYEISTRHLSYDYQYSCGIGTGERHVDSKSFGYPFDRTIDEYNFDVPNMYFKDVEIHHEDTFKPYYDDYKNYGHFDYSFHDDYYTAKDIVVSTEE